MSAEDRINNILLLWQEHRGQGHDLSAAELCRDCPELVSEVSKQLQILRHGSPLLVTSEARTAVREEQRKQPPVAGRPEEAPTSLSSQDRQTLKGGPSEDGSDISERSSLPAVQVPGYEIVKELGRGGMGVVYLARQTRLGRWVALKMVLAGVHARSGDLHRFQTEAEAVARLQHPNIVQVFEVGEHEGRPFFSLEFCPGGGLDRKLAGSPLPPEVAARLVETLAGAVQAAHQANVLHRDLKPGNVLLAEDGTPKITDFGLAKKMDEAGQTQTGSVIGTPSYMAPEQAEGKKAVGPAADVYALGAILYECLTGRPPFKAALLHDTMLQVINQEPVPPRQLNAKVPLDLETISFKCLEKQPASRYGTAQDLAEDLQRFRAGEPIRARPVGWLGRTLKWVKRRPTLAALSAVCVLAGVALLGLGFWFSAAMGAAGAALRAKEDRACNAERLGQTHEFFGLLRGVEKRSARPQPGWTWANREDLAKAAALPLASEHLAELRSEAALALGSIDMRQVRTVAENFQAGCLAFQPGGSLLALGPFKTVPLVDGAVLLVDPRQPCQQRTLPFRPGLVLDPKLGLVQDGIRALAFSPDGRFLVGGSRSGFLHCWSVSQKVPAQSWQAHKECITWVRFSPDGAALFTAADDRTVKRWVWAAPDLAATAPRCDRTWQADNGIDGLACHPDGWLVCGTGGEKTHFLSGDTLLPLRPPLARGNRNAQFAPDGETLAGVAGPGVNLGSLRDDRLLRTLLPQENDSAEQGILSDLAFSPDGNLLVSTWSQTWHVKLWETASGRLLADLFVGGRLIKAGFSPDGRLLAVTAGHKTLLYEIGGLREQTFVAGHPKPILTFALHPDGHSLAVQTPSLWEDTGRDVVVWRLDPGPTARIVARHTVGELPSDSEPRISFHPRSQGLAFTAASHLYYQDSAGLLAPQPLAAMRNVALSFGPDGRLWGAWTDQVRVWNPASGKQLLGWCHGLAGHLSGLAAIYSVSAGSQWAAAGGRDGQVHIFHAANASRTTGAIACQAPVRAVAVNSDETLLTAASEKGELCLLSVPDGAIQARGTPHQDRVEALSWSSSGLLASGSRDRTVKLWSCAGGRLRELLTLPQPGPVRWLAFHPDGARLFVVLDRDRAVRVWHLDHLFARLTEMGLGADLEPIQKAPLQAPAAAPSPPSPVTEAARGPNGLKAELFADMELRRCVKVRYDAQVDWDWGVGAPDPLLPVDHFSIRWTGWLKAPRAGRYTLQLDSADGARLWLDGKRLLDRWQHQQGILQVEVELSGQPQALRLECFKFSKQGWARFLWAQEGGKALHPVPMACLFHDTPR